MGVMHGLGCVLDSAKDLVVCSVCKHYPIRLLIQIARKEKKIVSHSKCVLCGCVFGVNKGFIRTEEQVN